MSARQTPESFWARVDVRDLDECWPWLGSVNNTGYGSVGWHGVTYVAHRLAAWLLGLVTDPAAPKDRTGGGFLLHSCDTPGCCNPTHWEIGAYAKNQADAYARGRRTQPRGAHHANARMNAALVEMVRTDAGATRQVDWAALLGVSQKTISNVLRGETYGG